MSDLYNNFQKYFEIVLADTPELLENVYRIRYQVLCVEQRLPGFDASSYPDKLERDDYDDQSSHILLRHLPSGNFIGTVRLIMFDQARPEKLFPIELYGQLDSALLDIKTLPRHQSGEISRFVISSQFDRRKGDRRKGGECNHKEKTDENSSIIERRIADRRDRRVTPPLALLLAAGIVRLSAQRNIHNWLSVMDPALNRLLGFYGLELNPIGPLVNYHGLRRSYYAKVEDVLKRMHKEYYDAWEIVTDYGTYDPSLSSDGKIILS
jgi:N-acyl amino acid synthase of PEP-CTERM/exosortase system